MTEVTSGPGRQLRAERESLGVTLREVADTLNLSIAVVQALEADDYERLPGAVFARGYIRAYSRLLDLVPVPLLELYPGRVGGREAEAVVHEAGVAEWVRRRPALVLSVLTLVGAGLLAMLAALVWPEGGIESLWRASEPPAVVLPPADTTSDWGWDADGQARSPAASDAGDNGGAAAGAASSGTDSAAQSPGQSGFEGGVPPPGVDSAVVEGTEEPDANGNRVHRLTATGNQRLQMGFSADSWVEIRSSSGRVLYSNLNKTGTSLELIGQGPFRILLGYAPGVTLTFESEQVALAPHTRNNVATLVLGQ